MKSVVYVVMKGDGVDGRGPMHFDTVFRKKKLAEQYVEEHNKIAGFANAEIIISEFKDTEFFIEKNKNKPYVEKKREAKEKFDRQFKFAQKVASLINMIYYEKGEKKRKLIEDSLFICQKSRHNIRNHEEMLCLIYNVKNTLKGYKGGFVNPDAEYYYMTKIYPIFEKHGDEAFVYFLDQIK